MTTTKEQERKALEKIKRIVSELGDDSYVATAFEGCIELAEENITNDFALSMKSRCESAENTILDCKNKITELEENLNTTRADYDDLMVRMKDLSKCIISDEELQKCSDYLHTLIAIYNREASIYSMTIVKFADTPDNPEFTEAVKYHRICCSEIEAIASLSAKIDSLTLASATTDDAEN